MISTRPKFEWTAVQFLKDRMNLLPVREGSFTYMICIDCDLIPGGKLALASTPTLSCKFLEYISVG